MKIVNKRKFIRTVSILIIIIISLIIFTKSTYSKGEIEYIENYIYNGDTLWSIANKQIIENKYFEGKDIRFVIDELKNINNLANSDVYEGEKIKIPVYK